MFQSFRFNLKEFVHTYWDEVEYFLGNATAPTKQFRTLTPGQHRPSHSNHEALPGETTYCIRFGSVAVENG
jgi:hypothetical protein